MKENVLVCTDMRGVFAGQLESRDGDAITLTQARMCVYWDRAVRGVLGLAVSGPNERCRITKAVPRIQLDGVTAVIYMTGEAVSAWDAEPWG